MTRFEMAPDRGIERTFLGALGSRVVNAAKGM